jgi:hypothetical protein
MLTLTSTEVLSVAEKLGVAAKLGDEQAKQILARQIEPSRVYLATELGKQAVRSLGEALDSEITRQMKKPISANLLRDLSLLTNNRLVIAGFLGNDLKNNADFRHALRRLVSYDGDESQYLPLRLILTFAEHEGYDDIPIRALVAVLPEVESYKDCDAIKKLVRGVYDSHPTEFRERFLIPWESQTWSPRDLFISDCWDREVIACLCADSDTRHRVIDALTKKIESTRGEYRAKLKSLLPAE